MKLTTAMVLQRFRLTQSPDEKHDGNYFASLIAPPKVQLLIRPVEQQYSL
jgi:hypothetical protein